MKLILLQELKTSAVDGHLSRKRNIPPHYLRRNCSAKRSEETLNCSVLVESHFCGYRNNACTFCSALRWSEESNSICCYSGKTNLSQFPDPPELLKELFSSQDERAVVFRKYIRQLNNALAMASIKIGNITQDVNSFVPTVFLQVLFFCSVHLILEY